MKKATDFYPFESSGNNLSFFFQSIGRNGAFDMAILFQPTEPGRFNLALCVFAEGRLLDNVTTNNNDFSKILSTVAVALREFFISYPNAYVQIGASDNKRLRIYNGIFRRKHLEIVVNYQIEGIIEADAEPYDPEKSYRLFVIHLRRT